jgi:hypothetical protein
MKKSLKILPPYIYENELGRPEWFEDHFNETHPEGMGIGKGRRMKNNF